jgi:Kef-type K+ transport system membrane component KefB
MAESNPGTHFLWIAIILLVAKLSNLVVRYGQPPVLGELLVGVLFGNLSLAGFYFFEPIRQDLIIRFLAELGVVILLFQVGLESNVKKMLRVGPRAFLVAWIGVLVPNSWTFSPAKSFFPCSSFSRGDPYGNFGRDYSTRFPGSGSIANCRGSDRAGSSGN